MRSWLRAVLRTTLRAWRASFCVFSSGWLDEEASAKRARGCVPRRRFGARTKKTPAGWHPAGVVSSISNAWSAGEDAVQLLLDLHFLRLRRHRDLLDQERARG